MNKAELIDAIAESTGRPKAAVNEILDDFQRVIKEEVAKGGDVTLLGFGRFDSKTRMARTYRNPLNGVSVDVPTKRVPFFKPGSAFKAVLL